MFVVTLPVSASRHPDVFARTAKKAGAGLLEIRLDLTPEVKPFHSALPILLSPRGRKSRHDFSPRFVDLESSETFDTGKAKLIVSHHDYKRTLSLAALKAIVRRMQKHKPWAVKIATNVTVYRDLKTLFDLQAWLKKKRIRSMVLGMGDKAHLSRALSPLKNALTYAAMDGYESSASGQLPLSFYALTKGKRKPNIFGIVGGPHITASLSPVIHNALFQRHKIDALYSLFPSTDFTKTMKELSALGVVGYSVTAPFKRDAFIFADVHDPISQKIGVANMLVKKRDKWHAYNTDVFGVLDGYPELRKAKKVAILGAGGAVPAVIEAIRMANYRAEVTVFARDITKAKRELLQCEFKIRSFVHVEKSTAEIVICAVSEDVTLPLPSPRSPRSIAIDLRYGKLTEFMKAAKKKRYNVKDGTSMLIHQALAQCKHFTGRAPKKGEAEYLTSVLQPYATAFNSFPR